MIAVGENARVVCAVVAALAAVSLEAAGGTFGPQNPARVKEIAAMLRPEAGFAETRVGNRGYWGQFHRSGVVDSARKFAAEGPIVPDDGRFADKSYNWGQMLQDDLTRLRIIAFAEAVENKGEFLPALCGYLDFFSSRRTWTGRYHDKQLRNFNGEAHFIELGNGHISTGIATVLDVFRDTLPKAVRDRALAALRERTIDTYLGAARDLKAAKKAGSWIFGTANWNVSCNGSMVGAILLVIDDRQSRAEAIELAERSSRGFVPNDFTAEGLCVEGTGYWSYGVGCYMKLLGWVKRGTGSYLDFALNDRIYLSSYETNYLDGRGPKFGDCNGGGASVDTQVLCEQVWPGHAQEDCSLLRHWGIEAGVMHYGALKDYQAYMKRPIRHYAYPARSWFPDRIAMYVGRPLGGGAATNRLYAAIQGSYNARPHGHNDVGSYTVAVDGFDVLDDVGSAVYKDDSFGKDRFKNKMRNSWGHPVPLVGGKIQTPGKDSRGVILSTDFTDERDTLVYDLKSAYPEAAGLEKLTRQFEYLRAENRVKVTDRVEFSSASAFETALASFGKIAELGGGEYRFTSKNGQKALVAKVKVTGSPWHFKVEEMPEVAGSQWAWGKGLQKPYRAAVVLDNPVTKAEIEVDWRLAE